LSVTIGTKLGSYEITARIGAGGMGVVYRALDTKLKREVAIKITRRARGIPKNIPRTKTGGEDAS
jgi:serine/threonine-protein kinase